MNRILFSFDLKIIFRFPRMVLRDCIIMSLLLALSEVIHLIFALVKETQSMSTIRTTYFLSDLQTIGNVQKTVSHLRCSPVCLPGIRWNPTRSAWRQSFGVPADVFSLMASIQWAVTAINGDWFGSDQQSVVKDIFRQISVTRGKYIKQIFKHSEIL